MKNIEKVLKKILRELRLIRKQNKKALDYKLAPVPVIPDKKWHIYPPTVIYGPADIVAIYGCQIIDENWNSETAGNITVSGTSDISDPNSWYNNDDIKK